MSYEVIRDKRCAKQDLHYIHPGKSLTSNHHTDYSNIFPPKAERDNTIRPVETEDLGFFDSFEREFIMNNMNQADYAPAIFSIFTAIILISLYKMN